MTSRLVEVNPSLKWMRKLTGWKDSQFLKPIKIKYMNEMFIADLARKIWVVLVATIGILMLIFVFAVWLTNGTIIDRVKPKVIHDTIYLPNKIQK